MEISKKKLFFFPFSTHPASFKKMSFLAILVGGWGEGGGLQNVTSWIEPK